MPIAAKRSQLIRFKRTKQRGHLAVHARITKAMTISRSLSGNAYMLIETPKLNDADPPAWLTDVLAWISKNKVYCIDERLPRYYAEPSA